MVPDRVLGVQKCMAVKASQVDSGSELQQSCMIDVAFAALRHFGKAVVMYRLSAWSYLSAEPLCHSA